MEIAHAAKRVTTLKKANVLKMMTTALNMVTSTPQENGCPNGSSDASKSVNVATRASTLTRNPSALNCQSAVRLLKLMEPVLIVVKDITLKTESARSNQPEETKIGQEANTQEQTTTGHTETESYF